MVVGGAQRRPLQPVVGRLPSSSSARLSSKLVKDATLKVYEGGDHGLADTHKDRLNADLLDFLRG